MTKGWIPRYSRRALGSKAPDLAWWKPSEGPRSRNHLVWIIQRFGPREPDVWGYASQVDEGGGIVADNVGDGSSILLLQWDPVHPIREVVSYRLLHEALAIYAIWEPLHIQGPSPVLTLRDVPFKRGLG